MFSDSSCIFQVFAIVDEDEKKQQILFYSMMFLVIGLVAALSMFFQVSARCTWFEQYLFDIYQPEYKYTIIGLLILFTLHETTLNRYQPLYG